MGGKKEIVRWHRWHQHPWHCNWFPPASPVPSSGGSAAPAELMEMGTSERFQWIEKHCKKWNLQQRHLQHLIFLANRFDHQTQAVVPDVLRNSSKMDQFICVVPVPFSHGILPYGHFHGGTPKSIQIIHFSGIFMDFYGYTPSSY